MSDKQYWAVIMSDVPSQAAIMKASSKEKAIQAGKLYIRQWQLDASVLAVFPLASMNNEERRAEANKLADEYFNKEGWKYVK